LRLILHPNYPYVELTGIAKSIEPELDEYNLKMKIEIITLIGFNKFLSPQLLFHPRSHIEDFYFWDRTHCLFKYFTCFCSALIYVNMPWECVVTQNKRDKNILKKETIFLFSFNLCTNEMIKEQVQLSFTTFLVLTDVVSSLESLSLLSGGLKIFKLFFNPDSWLMIKKKHLIHNI